MPMDMKSTIAETYLRMVQHKNVDKITVKALIEECHISRQTFYYHFQDIMDVLEWSTRQATRKLVERSLQAEDMRSAVRIFIDFSVEHRPMLQKLMESQRRAQVEQIMLDSAAAYLEQMAQSRPHDVAMSGMEREVLLRYVSCGLVGVLLYYGGKKDLDRERLADQLGRILLEGLSGWKENRR